MTPAAIRSGLAAMVLMCAVAATGCGVGPGEATEGTAALTVTRDYGAEILTIATLEDPTPSDTVVRFLDDNADIDTDYGGNFVSTIDGLEGSTVDGGPEDWFFFVNGIYSELGAGEVEVDAGDEIWWDYRRWSEAYRVPAVVGSFPEPFLEGYGDGKPSVVLECVGAGAPTAAGCDAAMAGLEAAGIEATREDVAEPVPHPEDLRILVGAWGDLRSDPAASQLEDGPGTSGIYANVAPCGSGYRFEILGSDARVRQQFLASGLVAAVREGDDAPTWIVAGTVPGAVDEAGALLNEEALADRYAVISGDEGEPLPVPAADDLPVLDVTGCR